MQFSKFLESAKELKNKQQDLISTAYVVFPVADQFRFISYFDLDAMAIGYTVVDDRFVEVKLLSELPAPIMIAFGKFVDTIEKWQEDGTSEFPYAQFAGDNAKGQEIRSPFQFTSPDTNIDGDEARLQ